MPTWAASRRSDQRMFSKDWHYGRWIGDRLNSSPKGGLIGTERANNFSGRVCWRLLLAAASPGYLALKIAAILNVDRSNTASNGRPRPVRGMTLRWSAS